MCTGGSSSSLPSIATADATINVTFEDHLDAEGRIENDRNWSEDGAYGDGDHGTRDRFYTYQEQLAGDPAADLPKNTLESTDYTQPYYNQIGGNFIIQQSGGYGDFWSGYHFSDHSDIYPNSPYTPTTLSVRVGGNDHEQGFNNYNEFRLSDSNKNTFLRSYFPHEDGSGPFIINDTVVDSNRTNGLYQLELTNIDWDNATFDMEVYRQTTTGYESTPIYSGTTMSFKSGKAGNLDHVWLHASSSGHVYFDALKFPTTDSSQPTTEDPVDASFVQGFEPYPAGELPPKYRFTANEDTGTARVVNAADIGPSAIQGSKVLAVSWNEDRGSDTRILGPLNPATEATYRPSTLSFWVFDALGTPGYDKIQLQFWDQANDAVFGLFTDERGILINGTVVQSDYWNSGWHKVTFTNIDWTGGTVDVRIDEETVARQLSFTGDHIQKLYLRPRGFDEGDFLVDQIKIGQTSESPTTSTTTTQTTTTSTTLPPTTTRTTTQSYALKQGSTTELDIGYQNLYIISEIPDTDPGRLAVTTTNYNLVDVNTAYDALISYIYAVENEYLDASIYQQWITESINHRNGERFDELLYRLEEQLTNLLEAYTLSKIGVSNLTINTAVDGLTDSIVWGQDWAEQPYKRRMTELTATAQTGLWMDSLAQDVDSVSKQSSQLSETLNLTYSAYDTYSQTKDLTKAFQQIVTAAGPSTGSSTALFTSGIRQAASVAKGIVVGMVIDYTFNQIEDWFAMNAEISAIRHAYYSTRIPLLRKLQTLIQDAQQNALSATQALEIDILKYTLEQLRALTFDFTAQYYGAMSNMAAGPIWNTLQDASQLAETHETIANRCQRNAQLTLVGMGALESRRRELLSDSINAELTGGGGQ